MKTKDIESKLTFNLDKDLLKALEDYSVKNDLNKSIVMRIALRKFLEKPTLESLGLSGAKPLKNYD